MSANMVDAEHIHVLVTAAAEASRRRAGSVVHFATTRDIDTEKGIGGAFGPFNSWQVRIEYADHIGQMLLDQNADSVNELYSQDDAYIYSYHRPRFTDWTVPELLSALHGYEYQACETADWTDSDAYRFCRALERSLIDALPGYSDGPWLIDETTEPAAISERNRRRAARKEANA